MNIIQKYSKWLMLLVLILILHRHRGCSATSAIAHLPLKREPDKEDYQYEKAIATLLIDGYCQKTSLSYVHKTLTSIILAYFLFDAQAAFNRLKTVPLFKNKPPKRHYPGLNAFLARRVTPLNLISLTPIYMSKSFIKLMRLSKDEIFSSIAIEDVFCCVNEIKSPNYAAARRLFTAKDLYTIDEKILQRIKSDTFIKYYLASDEATKKYHIAYFGEIYSQFLSVDKDHAGKVEPAVEPSLSEELALVRLQQSFSSISSPFIKTDLEKNIIVVKVRFFED